MLYLDKYFTFLRFVFAHIFQAYSFIFMFNEKNEAFFIYQNQGPKYKIILKLFYFYIYLHKIIYCYIFHFKESFFLY